MAEEMVFAAGCKVEADIELRSLSSVNQIFERLEHGGVGSLVVFTFTP
jgi:alcohol dehydrogenase, propanol-preferring